MIKLENIKTIEVSNAFTSQVDTILKARLGSPRNHGRQIEAIEKMLTNRGKDRLYTRLKRLNFQSFTAQKAGDKAFIVGKTDDIVLEIRGDKYNLGPYYVATSSDAVIGIQGTPVHFFHAYNPTTRNRHLHHYASPKIWGDTEITNPLIAAENTCWASVGPSYFSALQDCDIADMFRILYIFLIRLDWHSPLCSSWTPEAIRNGVRL